MTTIALLQGIEVLVDLDEPSIVVGQRLMATIGVRNVSGSPIRLLVPVGADAKRLFMLDLASANGGAHWPAADLDPRSFSASVERELQPGEEFRRRVEHLHFFIDGRWTQDLPVGHYHLSCVFHGRPAAPASFMVEQAEPPGRDP